MSEKRWNIVFDFGGVLVDWDPRHLYREYFQGDESKMEWFLQNVCTQTWNEEHDLGIPFSKNAPPLIERFPEFEDAILAYRSRWSEMLKGVFPDTLQLLEELREKDYPLYGLTNWSMETFPLAKKRFEFLGWFKGIVVSGELGIKKPDPRIYEHLLSTYRLKPAETVFIDDRKANIQAAQGLGIHGIHYQSAAQLRASLSALGID